MNKKNTITTLLVSILSSVLAFLGIISCCGFPLIAAFVALFGIGASQLEFLSQYQTLSTSIAIISLAYGFYIVYFKKSKIDKSFACCDTPDKPEIDSTCCKPNTTKNRFTKVLLWLSTIAIISILFMGKDAETPKDSDEVCCPVPVKTIEQAPAEKSCCTSN